MVQRSVYVTTQIRCILVPCSRTIRTRSFPLVSEVACFEHDVVTRYRLFKSVFRLLNIVSVKKKMARLSVTIFLDNAQNGFGGRISLPVQVGNSNVSSRYLLILCAVAREPKNTLEKCPAFSELVIHDPINAPNSGPLTHVWSACAGT